VGAKWESNPNMNEVTIMSELPEKDEGIYVHRSGIKVPYQWHAGEYATYFYKQLREKKIWGTKCPKCGKVYVPPKKICIECFKQCREWVELSDTGTLLTYTIVRYSEPLIQPREPPFAYGIIKLDGADTGMVHFLGEVDFDKIKVGMRVKAVFNENPEGNYLDIKYFKPVG
jgi:uncharacterized OB-fold protein